jgi:hypothetical protein
MSKNIIIEPRWITGRAAISAYSGLSMRRISQLFSDGTLPHKRHGNTVSINVALCAPIIDRLHEQGN